MTRHMSVAITGASGALYGIRLLQLLLQQHVHVSLMISSPARVVIATETNYSFPSNPEQLVMYLAKELKFDPVLLNIYSKNQWLAPVASGSAAPEAMIICPCSTGTLSAVANGSSRSLIERAADVMLKERRQLILVPRETPLSSVHLENMLKLSNHGVTILPAMPAFYHKPVGISGLVDFVVARILDHVRVGHTLVKPWGSVQDESS